MMKTAALIVLALALSSPYKVQTEPEEFNAKFIEGLPLLHARRQIFVTLTGRLVSSGHRFGRCQVFYANRSATGEISIKEPIDAECELGRFRATQVYLSQEINRATIDGRTEMVVYPPSFFFAIRAPGCADSIVEHKIRWKNRDPKVKLGRIRVACE